MGDRERNPAEKPRLLHLIGARAADDQVRVARPRRPISEKGEAEVDEHRSGGEARRPDSVDSIEDASDTRHLRGCRDEVGGGDLLGNQPLESIGSAADEVSTERQAFVVARRICAPRRVDQELDELRRPQFGQRARAARPP